MKTLIAICLAVLVLPLFSEEEAKAQTEVVNFESWIALSAASQNCAYAIAKQDPGSTLNPDMFKDFISAIRSNISALVKSGYLERDRVALSYRQLFANGHNKMSEFVFKISDKYGYYVSKELLGMGIEFQLKVYKPEDEVVLEVALPPRDMVDLKKYVTQNIQN
jgi:hypothetical protein